MIEINECTEKDIKLLAEMNKQLIEDEKSNNLMDVTQLESRMNDFLNNEYKAFFFIVEKKIIGYALCDMTKEPKYLRQFFIKREERRKHYGKNAFNKLLEKLGIQEIEIDVLKCNEDGIKFWENIGFKEQWKRMSYQIQAKPLRRVIAISTTIRHNKPTMKTISTNSAPAAIGPYSQAIIANGLLFASGQIPLSPETGAVVFGGIKEQTEQVMRNIAAVLTAAGTDFSKVVKATCFLTSMDNFAAFNEVYAQYFTANKPARSCVAVSALPRGVLVEVEVIAEISG